jgi:hypothetical protein
MLEHRVMGFERKEVKEWFKFLMRKGEPTVRSVFGLLHLAPRFSLPKLTKARNSAQPLYLAYLEVTSK